jgi:hypothetical protein
MRTRKGQNSPSWRMIAPYMKFSTHMKWLRAEGVIYAAYAGCASGYGSGLLLVNLYAVVAHLYP